MSIKQAVIFVDGPYESKCAKLSIDSRFVQGMVFDVHGHLYQVQYGPIAECIERSQEPLEHGMVRLALASEPKQ